MKMLNSMFYEIRSTDDIYGLIGVFESPAKALEEINRSYKIALECGFDNRHEKWVIVRNRTWIRRDDEGNFASSEVERYVVNRVEFSETAGKFVIVD